MKMAFIALLLLFASLLLLASAVAEATFSADYPQPTIMFNALDGSELRW